MMTNKDRFTTEEQFEIAMESIEKAYVAKFGKTGEEDMGVTEYEDFIDQLLFDSDESAFEGTNEEIAEIWNNPEMF